MLDAGPRNVRSAMERELQRRLKEYVITPRTLSLRQRQRRDGCLGGQVPAARRHDASEQKARCCSKIGER